ncbi:MAG: hypothetical protein M3033_08260 [Acidobacteriota bacterium]|nr:hypothetical protein [Acidobacteriota bacterium]
MIQENEEQKETEINHTTENLESVEQMIIGGLEQIGGILTGDPATRAEGEFNAQVGSLHQEANKNLTAIDENERADNDASYKSEK